MGMTMTGLNPNGFPQPPSLAPAPAMGIMAMMAAAAPQPAALSVGGQLPVVDTIPEGSSLESGGRRRESSSPSVSLINIGGAGVATAGGATSTVGLSSVPSVSASSRKLSTNETLGIPSQQSQLSTNR